MKTAKVHYAQIDYGVDRVGCARGALCPCGVGGRATNYEYTQDKSLVTCQRCLNWLKAEQTSGVAAETSPKEPADE